MIVRFALALALAAALAGASGHRVALAASQLPAGGLMAEPSSANPSLGGRSTLLPSSEPGLSLPGGPSSAGPGTGLFAGQQLRDDEDFSLPSVPTVEPVPDGEGFTLSAEFEVPLTRSLADAVGRGVPLYFVIEFEMYRPRWWWYDELVVERSKTWRLAYHALTRQYRVTADGVIYPFDSLEAALRSIVRVRNWRVVSAADELSPGTVYEAQVRLRLDTSQLPKPFQIRGLTNRDWNPQAEWKRFTFTAPTAKSGR